MSDIGIELQTVNAVLKRTSELAQQVAIETAKTQRRMEIIYKYKKGIIDTMAVIGHLNGTPEEQLDLYVRLSESLQTPIFLSIKEINVAKETLTATLTALWEQYNEWFKMHVTRDNILNSKVRLHISAMFSDSGEFNQHPYLGLRKYIECVDIDAHCFVNCPEHIRTIKHRMEAQMNKIILAICERKEEIENMENSI